MMENPPSSSPLHRTVDAADAFFGYYPGSVAVVTTRDQGKRNVMSAGWHTALSAEPPLYGVAVAPERYSHQLLVASGLFGVNFLPFDLAERIAGAGLLSGAEGGDKLARLGLGWYEDQDGPPLLSGAYLAYSCRVQQRIVTGDHDLFVGAVTHVHYDPAAFDGRLKSRQHKPAVLYYGRSLYESAGSGATTIVPPETFRSETPTGGSK